MTEKIIIDGIDVSGCICLDEWKHCDICHTLIKTIGISRNLCLLEQDLRCETYPNCNYKQRQRSKAQYDAVVEQNKRLQTELKNLTELVEEAKEAPTCFQCEEESCIRKENEKLKYECEKMKRTLNEYANCINKGDAIINKVMNMRLEQHESIINRYKQALAPFEDEYFKDLDTKTIAELAKKSIRLTTKNRKLEDAFDEIEHKVNESIYCRKSRIIQSAYLDEKVLAIINKAKEVQ